MKKPKREFRVGDWVRYKPALLDPSPHGHDCSFVVDNVDVEDRRQSMHTRSLCPVHYKYAQFGWWAWAEDLILLQGDASFVCDPDEA